MENISCFQFLGEAFWQGGKRIGAFHFGKCDISKSLDKEVIIWGTGELAHRCFCFLSNYSINVSAFCDNDSSHWGKKFMGLPILSPDEAYIRKPYFIVCTSGWFLWLITRQLIVRHGDEFGCFFTHGYGNFFDDPELMSTTVDALNIMLSNEFEYGNVSAWYDFIQEQDPPGMYAELCQTTEFWDTTLVWLRERPVAKRMLDIGPGWGLLSAILRSYWPDTETFYLCYGEEGLRERDVIDRRNKKYDVNKIYGFVESPAFELDEKFDLILFTEVLEHFSCNPIPTLQKIANWLTEDGVLALTTPTTYADPTNTYDSYKQMPDFIDFTPDAYATGNIVSRRFIDPSTGHIHIFNKTELEEIFEACGLNVMKYDINAAGRHQVLLMRNQ